MATIHPTAIVAPGAAIGSGVRIGPFCIVGADVVIGDGAELVSHVVIDGHTSVGAGAVLSPFVSLGLPPQDLKYRGEPTRCELGARSQLREHVSVHRGTPSGIGVTRIGADCLLMAASHVAHDCQVGDAVVIANNVMLAGHVTVGDHTIIYGGSAVQQFVRVGRGVMIGGLAGVERDVIPFGTVLGNRAWLNGLNVIGMRRRGFDRAQVHALRVACRFLFNGPGVIAERLAHLRATAMDDAAVAEVLAFIDGPSKRGLIRTDLADDIDDDDAGAAK